MIHILINWLISALLILAVAYILPGVVVVGLWVAIVVALVLGLINAIIRPVAIFLTLPINIITLGLFTFVLDALLILLAAKVVSGFEVESFWWALLLSLILSIANSYLKKAR
jgi:putative membrane protein